MSAGIVHVTQKERTFCPDYYNNNNVSLDTFIVPCRSYVCCSQCAHVMTYAKWKISRERQRAWHPNK